MYANYFGLTQDPFSIAPDPRYLFMSERHREALAHLLFGIAGSNGVAAGTGGGFVLLTGDIGTGKTTICRCLLEQIPKGCRIAYIFNPKLTVSELLQSICDEFHIHLADTASTPPTVKDYIDALNAFLLESHAAGRSSVLIIDEAQNLEPEVLEQLRLLTNLETRERKLLQIVLIGQPELRQMLERAELEQLAQRVIARFHLDALNELESTQYIEHRLVVSGLTGPTPFDRSALQRIHRLARGVPRRLNLLCGRSLLGAWANGLQRVDRGVVDKAALEVFGADYARKQDAGRRLKTYLLGALLVLASAAAASYLLWPAKLVWPPATRPTLPEPATAGTPPAVAMAPPDSATNGLASASSAMAPASAPQAAAPHSSAAAALRPLAAQSPVQDAQALLPELTQDVEAAWRELAGIWKLPATPGASCQVAATQKLQCYRSSNLSLPHLRHLGLPGLLTLQAPGAAPVYALLVGLSEQTATLQTAKGLQRIRLLSLGRLWAGEFATFWRTPVGYRPELRDGASGPAIELLTQQLDLLEGAPARAPNAPPAVLNAALRARVRAFQVALGMLPDGQPGPMTFMQLDSAARKAAGIAALAAGTQRDPQLFSDKP
jgi:general secretion pathway protein A